MKQFMLQLHENFCTIFFLIFHVSFHKNTIFSLPLKIGKALKKSSPKTDLPLDECNEWRIINW